MNGLRLLMKDEIADPFELWNLACMRKCRSLDRKKNNNKEQCHGQNASGDF